MVSRFMPESLVYCQSQASLRVDLSAARHGCSEGRAAENPELLIAVGHVFLFRTVGFLFWMISLLKSSMGRDRQPRSLRLMSQKKWRETERMHMHLIELQDDFFFCFLWIDDLISRSLPRTLTKRVRDE